jgi:dipeptidyl aminopeptidase/acylaminoacyl peptidase
MFPKVCLSPVIALALIFSSNEACADLDARPFYEKAQIKTMKISPDGEHVAFNYEEGSEVKLATLHLDSQKLKASFGMGENQHVTNFWWSSDTRVVMSVREVTGILDSGGGQPRLYAANVDGSRREEIFASQDSSFVFLHPLLDDPEHIMIARYHWADEGVPKVHLVNTFRGTMNYIGDHPTTDNITGFIADNDGELRIATEYIEGETFDDAVFNLYYRTGSDWNRFELEAKRQPINFAPLGFSRDNSKVYFLSNHDMEKNDRLGAFRYDLGTDELQLLYRHPELDISGRITGHKGEVLGVITGFGQPDYIFFQDVAEGNEDAALMQRLTVAFSGREVGITSFSRDGSRAVVVVQSDRNPGEFYLFDTDTMQARFLSAMLPDLDKEKLVPLEALRIPARDGLKLHAFLARPEGQKTNLPLLVEVHGGPFDIADDWLFTRDTQYFANHGYAVLKVNFRGSGNRGDDFVDMGRREWGGKMQDDVTDATRWAIEQGIADPDRICIFGGSYGGYSAIMGMIKEPDLYQCGVGIAGIYDLVWFREGDGSDFLPWRDRESVAQFERFLDAYVGEDADELRPYSPAHNVEKIKGEVFIAHGGDDVRVPVEHAYRLRTAMDAIGKSYEWMIKEDEGHGFFDVDNRVDLAERMLSFFDRNIGED